MHVQRYDVDGNGLTIAGGATGRVVIEIDGQHRQMGQRASIESDDVVLVAYEMLRLVRDAEGSDAVDNAIVALRPYAEEADREAHRADALGTMVGDET